MGKRCKEGCDVGKRERYGLLMSDLRPIQILDCLQGRYENEIAEDVRKGLTLSQKAIPSKYFYDSRGSKLFEDICKLPEYYLTQIEISILKNIAPKFSQIFRHKDLVELGSGADLKIRTMLDVVGRKTRATLRYVPVDISESAIFNALQSLLELYPELEVLGIVADFTCQLHVIPSHRPAIFCFLGSTIGNFNEAETLVLLRNVAGAMKLEDTLLIGFDMVKSREILEAAYNDSNGVTSEFNKNILNVINGSLHGNFDPCSFDHLAFYNEKYQRIEMHLKANCDFSVRLKDLNLEVDFTAGDTIHTEISRKFKREEIEELASHAGLKIANWYTDSEEWFSLVEMSCHSEN
jgi:L-histidine N-alpha-methyltransferase